MRAKLFTLLVVMLALIPALTLAHGGVEKSAGAGDITVYLTQQPLSPFIGEEVRMTFVVKKDPNEAIRNLDVELTLIDTFFNDVTKDTTISTEKMKTDANGAFDFYYTFNKENYFDVDLKFKHPETGEELDVGFLVQPRYRASLWYIILANGLILALIGIIIYRLIYGTRTTQKSS